MMTNDFPMFTEPQSYPFTMPQPFLQNFIQTVDFPVPQTIQPVIVPAPVGVPIPQPYGIPFDRPVPFPYFQPVAVPYDRPCAVPMPVGVPMPQPYAVPQPVFIREQVGVPVPMPVPVPVAAPQQVFELISKQKNETNCSFFDRFRISIRHLLFEKSNESSKNRFV